MGAVISREEVSQGVAVYGWVLVSVLEWRMSVG
jgi:hypothetical protein